MAKDIVTDPWQALRRHTPARVGLGRAGAGLPTAEVLRFGLAHARARDAVHLPLDPAQLEADLQRAGFDTLRVHSAAADRATFLVRPDLGRQLRAPDAQTLRQARPPVPADLCFVVADGLSACAVQRHAVPLLRAFHELAGTRWTRTPVVIAEQARVALGDEIGALLGARLAAVLIGERPGLSSPDSLGVYLTHAPEVGRTDAQRNCLSNIRPQGLAYPDAARRLFWLVGEAVRRQLTGIALKDQSDLRELPGERFPQQAD